MHRSEGKTFPPKAFPVLALFGLVAPFITFFVAVSSLAYGLKMLTLALLASVYAGLCVWAFRHLTAKPETGPGLAADESPLAALEDANELFGACLRRGDMFRLVNERLRQVVPVVASAYVITSDEAGYEIAESDGLQAGNVQPDLRHGLAALAFVSGELEIDPDLAAEKQALGGLLGTNVASAAAIPLEHDGSVFAVLELFLDDEVEDQLVLREKLDAIRARVTPLFLGALAIERSKFESFVDPITSLPNERAFMMVLEHQLAESLRHRDDRPLSVVAADVSSFTEINNELGRATGDEILKFIAAGLRSRMRGMDLLARSEGDEFLLLLPNTVEHAAEAFLERARKYFDENPFTTAEKEVRIRLNFGIASYEHDGETPSELKRAALNRKQHEKAGTASVSWIGKEYVN